MKRLSAERSGTSESMHLIIERADLLKCLGHVQSVVERRNTIPILAHVLLRTEDGRLGLTATDMDLEIVESSPATIHSRKQQRLNRGIPGCRQPSTPHLASQRSVFP